MFPHPEKLSPRDQFCRLTLSHNPQVVHYGSPSENVDGTNFVWEYLLLMQSFVNIYNFSTFDVICQLLTQHIVSRILYKNKVNNTFAITMKMMINFVNFFSDKTLKSVSLLYVKVSFTPTFATTR